MVSEVVSSVLEATLQRIRQFQEDWPQPATSDAKSHAPGPLQPVTVTVTSTDDEQILPQPPEDDDSLQPARSTTTSIQDTQRRPMLTSKEDTQQTDTAEDGQKRPTPPRLRNRTVSLPQSVADKRPSMLELAARRPTYAGARIRRNSSFQRRAEKKDFFRKYGPLGSFIDDSEKKTKKASKTEPKLVVLDPTSRSVHQWLAVVALAVSYFTWSIVFRLAFPGSLKGWLALLWFLLDTIFYCVLLVDFLVQSRTSYLQDGILEEDVMKIFNHYLSTWHCKVDVLAVLPLDWLWMFCALTVSPPPSLLLIRVLKYYRLWQFTDRSESRSRYSHACRILFMIHDLLVLIHLNACAYFVLSRWIGPGSDSWVYPSWNTTESSQWGTLSHQYIYSFYWSTMTLTTIGEVPLPETTLEFFFVTVDYFMGVLMFATVVGNIGNIINNMHRNRTKFQNKMSQIKNYMRDTNVPSQLQERVVKWFEYSWMYNAHMDEKQVLDSLPDKLKAEIGMHVHFETLKKVDFFAECEQGLLWELVLRLRTQVFSPGEFVCRKGDVGREMYIVNSGKLEVVAEENGHPLRILSHGESFGEISILDLGNNNRRRTAFVRSVGYSVLHCLNESDLLEVLRDYPKTKEQLVARGRRLLGEDLNSESDVDLSMLKGNGQRGFLSRQQSTSTLSCDSLLDSDEQISLSFSANLPEHMASTNHRLSELENLVHQVLSELRSDNSQYKDCYC